MSLAAFDAHEQPDKQSLKNTKRLLCRHDGNTGEVCTNRETHSSPLAYSVLGREGRASSDVVGTRRTQFDSISIRDRHRETLQTTQETTGRCLDVDDEIVCGSCQKATRRGEPTTRNCWVGLRYGTSRHKYTVQVGFHTKHAAQGLAWLTLGPGYSVCRQGSIVRRQHLQESSSTIRPPPNGPLAFGASGLRGPFFFASAHACLGSVAECEDERPATSDKRQATGDEGSKTHPATPASHGRRATRDEPLQPRAPPTSYSITTGEGVGRGTGAQEGPYSRRRRRPRERKRLAVREVLPAIPCPPLALQLVATDQAVTGFERTSYLHVDSSVPLIALPSSRPYRVPRPSSWGTNREAK